MPRLETETWRWDHSIQPGTSLKAELNPDINSLSPEVGRVEQGGRPGGPHQRRGDDSGAVDRWVGREVEHPINLVAGTNHVAHVEEIIADKGLDVAGDVEAHLQLHL